MKMSKVMKTATHKAEEMIACDDPGLFKCKDCWKELRTTERSFQAPKCELCDIFMLPVWEPKITN
jgi:Zn finger protein HypA/HybF involved in hydrogenase expression